MFFYTFLFITTLFQTVPRIQVWWSTFKNLLVKRRIIGRHDNVIMPSDNPSFLPLLADGRFCVQYIFAVTHIVGTKPSSSDWSACNFFVGERYKFRIVAVYINGGQEAGEVSDRVTMPETLDPLLPNDPPSMVPRITMARQTASNTLQVRWVYYGLDSESFTVQVIFPDIYRRSWFM